MRQTKNITSDGLAFSEHKDMEKLRQYSLKGWHVSGFTFVGYTLQKGESKDYIYSIDYRSLKKEEEEEYIDFFMSSGWTHISSEGDIHLFRAHPDTKPIYTDRDTMVEKYKNSTGSMKKLAMPFVFITILLWVGAIMSSGTLQSNLFGVAAILSIIALPTAWTIITTYRNKWKVEGREGLVHLIKVIPFLALLLVAILLLLVGNRDPDPAINFWTSIMAGAIALPTAIWFIISLYHMVRWRRDNGI